MTRLILNYFLLLSVVIASCQQEIGDPPIIPPTTGTIDSTLLVKAVRFRMFETDVEDFTENYSYDTVNRKIRITWTSDADHYLAGSGSTLQYDEAGYLVNVKYTFAPGTDLVPEDEIESSFEYDTEGILKTITSIQADGNTRITNFYKSSAASGYILRWTSRYPGQLEYHREAHFNSAGVATLVFRKYSTFDVNTGEIENTYTGTDSLILDGTNSIQRFYVKRTDSLHAISETLLTAEVDSRYTTGNNLYLQRKLLLGPGLINMPFTEGVDFFRPGISILGFMTIYEPEDYSRFPIKTGKHMTGNGMLNYTLTADIDSIGRMKKYDALGYDFEEFPVKIDISYFK